jgi:hypothetical protein
VGLGSIPVLVGSTINHESQKAEQWQGSKMCNRDQNELDVYKEIMYFGISLYSKLQI